MPDAETETEQPTWVWRTWRTDLDPEIIALREREDARREAADAHRKPSRDEVRRRERLDDAVMWWTIHSKRIAKPQDDDDPTVSQERRDAMAERELQSLAFRRGQALAAENE